MVKDGYIEITDKVRFVYYELKKPDLDNFKKHPVWAYAEYDKALKAYEASKRSVEVINKIQSLKTKKIRWIWLLNADNNWTRFKDNQPCRGKIENNKAEVNGKAEIIELL